MRATPAGLRAGSIETKEPVARTSLNLSDVQGTGASILCRCHEFNIIVHKSLQPSYTLYSRILSHIPSSSWGSYALYGAQCRSLSFSLLLRLWFWRSLTLAGIPSFQHAGSHECSGSTCLEDKSLW